MAKPILFYALAQSRFGSGFRVLGVTGEKHRQVYGRELPDDVATHCAGRDLIHRFPEGTTEEFALASGKRADRARTSTEPAVREARQKYEQACAHQKTTILEAAKGINP